MMSSCNKSPNGLSFLRDFCVVISLVFKCFIADLGAASVWKYEGYLDVPSKARICYWAPFDFESLKGIDWLLAIESAEGHSCLRGVHPESQSSLWQVNASGSLWLKRQGRFVAIVKQDESGEWQVTEKLPFPEDLNVPAQAIYWANDDGITVLEDGIMWNLEFGQTWRRLDGSKLDLTGFIHRGFVQTQSFLYYWGDENGLLIHKESGRIQRFLNDNWPNLLSEFEQLGTTWNVDGDAVSVRNSHNEVQLNLRQKTLYSNDLMFEGIVSDEEQRKTSKENVNIVRRLWFDFAMKNPFVIVLIGFGLGGVVGSLGFFVAWRKGMPHEKGSSVVRNQTGIDPYNGVVLSGLSAAFQALVLIAPADLSTEEFDQVVGNDAEQSPESQRSKRAKIIREVNNEAQLLIGYHLIERDRDEVDRRKLVYRVKAVPHRLVRRISDHRSRGQLSPLPGSNRGSI